MGIILNPSFEDALGAEWDLFTVTDCDNMSYGRSTAWATDGTHCWRTHLTAQDSGDGMNPGQQCITRLKQTVDFATISTILIDIRIDIEVMSAVCSESYLKSEIWHYDGNYHLLSERRFVKGDSTGTYLYLDESLDVSAYSGTGELWLKSEVSGFSNCGEMGQGTLRGAVMFDNIRDDGSFPVAGGHNRFTGGMMHRSIH